MQVLPELPAFFEKHVTNFSTFSRTMRGPSGVPMSSQMRGSNARRAILST